MYGYKAKDTHILWTIINTSRKKLFSSCDMYVGVNNM